MKVRLAGLEDLPELERLRRAMGYPGSAFLDEASYLQRALDRLRDCLAHLAELPDVRVLLLTEAGAPSGYLFLTVDERHGVTHQLQAHLVDFAVFSFDGLHKLMTRARKIVTAFENEYLVVDLPASDQRLQLWFYRCGFRPEENRVVKHIARGRRGAGSPAFRVRKARASDLPFILEVHAAFSTVYRPAGRDTDLESLEFHYQLLYASLDLEQQSDGHYFLLEEVSTQASAGYIFLQERAVGARKAFYIYDVAIAPAYAGRGLSAYLIGAAETVAGEQGALLFGDGSLSTAAMTSWHKQIGFVVDTTRFALDCRPRRMLNDCEKLPMGRRV